MRMHLRLRVLRMHLRLRVLWMHLRLKLRHRLIMGLYRCLWWLRLHNPKPGLLDGSHHRWVGRRDNLWKSRSHIPCSLIRFVRGWQWRLVRLRLCLRLCLGLVVCTSLRRRGSRLRWFGRTFGCHLGQIQSRLRLRRFRLFLPCNGSGCWLCGDWLRSGWGRGCGIPCGHFFALRYFDRLLLLLLINLLLLLLLLMMFLKLLLLKLLKLLLRLFLHFTLQTPPLNLLQCVFLLFHDPFLLSLFFPNQLLLFPHIFRMLLLALHLTSPGTLLSIMGKRRWLLQALSFMPQAHLLFLLALRLLLLVDPLGLAGTLFLLDPVGFLDRTLFMLQAAGLLLLLDSLSLACFLFLLDPLGLARLLFLLVPLGLSGLLQLLLGFTCLILLSPMFFLLLILPLKLKGVSLLLLLLLDMLGFARLLLELSSREPLVMNWALLDAQGILLLGVRGILQLGRRSCRLSHTRGIPSAVLNVSVGLWVVFHFCGQLPHLLGCLRFI